MGRTLTVISNVQPDVCGPCGGKCCQLMPGATFPSDFGDDLYGSVKAKIKTGLWQFDYWEGDIDPVGDLDHVYCVRPTITTSKGRFVDASWGGPCILWDKSSGCSLTFDDRPTQCRGLIPQPDTTCISPAGVTKEDAVWVPIRMC